MNGGRRYDGDLDKLGRRPDFDWSTEAMDVWLRESALRQADAALERGRRLEAGGAAHQDVLAVYAAAENAAAAHPDVQPAYAAELDRYAATHGLRGWYRRIDRGVGVNPDRWYVSVGLLRSASDGDVGRHYVHTPSGGATFGDGHSAWVVDRDSGRTVARFGVDVRPDVARRMAESWIYATESGGC